MNIWVLTMWILFKPADGGMTIEAKIPMNAGSNRAVCEEYFFTTKRAMVLHGIPETNEEGKEIILYPARVEGTCKLEKPNNDS